MRAQAAASRAGGKRAGFALLAVIWGTGLIAMLIVSFMTSGRLRLQAAANIAAAAQAASIAEGAITLATLTLLGRRDAAVGAEQTVHDGAPQFCVLDRAAVALAVEDEGGKIDLNAAPPELMQAALLGLGVDDSRAREIAAAIVAFRTPPTDAIGLTAAPSGDKPVAPKQALFETVMELDQVAGVDAALFHALLPLVTVHSRTPGVDARASPPGLFAALSGEPPAQVQALLASPYPNGLKRNDPRFPGGFNQPGDQSAFLIHAEARLAGGQIVSREAILDLRPPDGKPFAIREFRRGRPRWAARLGAIIASNGAGVPDC